MTTFCRSRFLIDLEEFEERAADKIGGETGQKELATEISFLSRTPFGRGLVPREGSVSVKDFEFLYGTV